MKILFLDIDGVLNAPGERGFEKTRCELIRYIREKTKCNIVITSERRLTKEGREKIERIGSQFNWGELDYTIHGPIVQSSEPRRASEIYMYLFNKTPKKYVVLDDYSLNIPYNNFIKVDPEICLTKELADIAIQILK